MERIPETVIIGFRGIWDATYGLYSHAILGRNVGLSGQATRALAAGELKD